MTTYTKKECLQDISEKKINLDKLKLYNDDSEIMYAAAQCDRKYLKYASARLRNNKTFISKTIKGAPHALKYASNELKNDPEFIKKIINSTSKIGYSGNILRYTSSIIRDNKDIVLDAVSKDGCDLQHASDRLKNDKDIVLSAIKQSHKAVKYISEHLKNDKDVMLAATASYGECLIYASSKLRQNKEFGLEVVKIDSQALGALSDKLKNDIDIVTQAITYFPEAIQYASDRLKNNYNLIMDAVAQDADILMHVSTKFKYNKENILDLIYVNDESIDYVDPELIFDKYIELAYLICSNNKKYSYTALNEKILNSITKTDEYNFHEYKYILNIAHLHETEFFDNIHPMWNIIESSPKSLLLFTHAIEASHKNMAPSENISMELI